MTHSNFFWWPEHVLCQHSQSFSTLIHTSEKIKQKNGRLEQRFILFRTRVLFVIRDHKPIKKTPYPSSFDWRPPEQRPGHLMVQLVPVALGTKNFFVDADGATQPTIHHNFFHFAFLSSAAADYYSVVQVSHRWSWMVPKLGIFPSTDHINSAEMTVFFHSFKVTSSCHMKHRCTLSLQRYSVWLKHLWSCEGHK